MIIHTAGQPSHDWSAKDPVFDFKINALATVNLLQLTKLYCSQSVFIFTSTNKVYGELKPKKFKIKELRSFPQDLKHIINQINYYLLMKISS